MTEKIKIMLSSPMNGKTKEEIDEERNEMAAQLFDKYDDNCEIMATLVEDHENKSDLECFAESVLFMSMADVLAMGYGWQYARGCRLEHAIAKAYKVPVIYLESDCKFCIHNNDKIDWEKGLSFGCLEGHKEPVKNCKDFEEY